MIPDDSDRQTTPLPSGKDPCGDQDPQATVAYTPGVLFAPECNRG